MATIQHFEAFWRVNEPVLGAALVDAPELSLAVDWSRRVRASVQASDLAALGAAPLAVGPVPVFASPTPADVLGWLYVSEGSSLGGAVIDRWLRAPHPGLRLRSFTPYPEGPGPMWRAYLRALGAWVGDDPGRTRAVVDAGSAVFDALASWLEPMFVGAVA